MTITITILRSTVILSGSKTRRLFTLKKRGMAATISSQQPSRTAFMVRANRATLNHAAMVHEEDCPAADGPHLLRLVERLGPDLAYELVTAEVEVAA